MSKAKPRFVVYRNPYQQESLFHSAWFKDILEQQFAIESWCTDGNYDAGTVFVVGCNHWIDPEIRNLFRGFRVIVDALWESNTGKWGGLLDTLEPQQIIFYGNEKNSSDSRARFVPNWFWYNESLWYRHRGWHHYRPRRTWKRLFLMPIGHYRPWRATVVEALKPWLDDSYWSLVSQAQFLPGTVTAKRLDHRHHEAQWFDDTHFSIVCESARNYDKAVPFLTEKTYKAIAGWHPFMLIGAPGLLRLVRQQGFKSFDNCFDESYDVEPNLAHKLDIIIENIKKYRCGGIDSGTESRVLYNRRRFYDKNLVISGLTADVIKPMKRYVDAD